jgi:hypothetical protein
MILGIPGMMGLFMWIESEEFGRQIKSVILVYFGTINSASCSIHSCIVHHGTMAGDWSYESPGYREWIGWLDTLGVLFLQPGGRSVGSVAN